MSTKTKLIAFAAGAVAATVGNVLLNRKSIGSNNSLSEDSHSRLGAARYDLGRPVIDDSFFDGDDSPL
jgi:outer membrane protein assembly factor BamE (lipoprotein component of BamABCDE complex)